MNIIFETSYLDYPFWYVLISFIFFILFINILLNEKFNDLLKSYYRDKYNRNFFAIVSFGLFFGFLFMGEPMDFWYSRQALNNSNYLSVEGEVKNFIPQNNCIDHTRESFTVKNIKFSYSNNNYPNAYYHKTKCQGGLIGSSKKVKIYYLPAGADNRIIKMWMQ